MIYSLLFINELRLAENHDWVIFILIICAFLYLFMMISLQRDASIKSFLLQSFEDSSNGFASWIITGMVTSFTLSILISQYIPFVPKSVNDLQLFGYQLNKFGFVFVSVLFFYISKAVLTFFFFESIGSTKKWSIFYFTGTKFYFIFSLVLLVFCILNFYFNFSRESLFSVLILFLTSAFIFKILFYLLHQNKILPQQWYYKFLYICTLQIAPLLVLWKLFFL